MSNSVRAAGVLSDWRANRGSPGIQGLLVLFRLCRIIMGPNREFHRKLLAAPLVLVYRVYSTTVYAFQLPVTTDVGPGLRLFHPFATVINRDSVIGSDVTLRHGTTLGSLDGGGSPTLGSGCDLGASCTVLGDIDLGAGTRVGAGAVVVKSTPPGSTVVGNPARILGVG